MGEDPSTDVRSTGILASVGNALPTNDSSSHVVHHIVLTRGLHPQGKKQPATQIIWGAFHTIHTHEARS